MWYTDKYKKLSVPVKATLWFALCNIIQKAANMITVPIFARLLSQYEFGLTSTFTAWENILILVVTLSLFKSLMNLFVKYEDKKKEYIVSCIMTLSLCITCIWGLSFLVFKNYYQKILGLPVDLDGCLFIIFLFQPPIQSWLLYKRYIYDYKRIIIFTSVMVGINTILSIFIVYNISQTAYSKIYPYVFSISLCGVFTYISIYRKNLPHIDKEISIFSLTFCMSLLPHYLSEYILQSSDKLIINYMCGPSDVAVYGLAYTVGNIITVMTGAIDLSFAPFEYRAIKKNRLNDLKNVTNCIVILTATFISIVMLFQKEVILLTGGKSYQESILLVSPICVGLFFNFVFRLFARVQEYYENKLFIVIPSVSMALLNLLLNIFFIPKFGYRAAAYTTVFCYAFFCILHFWFYRKVVLKKYEGKSIYNEKVILAISISVILIGIFTFLIRNFIFLKILIITLLAIIYSKKKKTILKFIKCAMESFNLD